MKYTAEEFLAIRQQVEHLGGAMLPETCDGRLIEYTNPKNDRKYKVKSCTCGNESIAVLPYEPTDDSVHAAREQRKRGAGFVRVCLVCDSLGLSPQFEHLIEREEDEADEEDED